MRELRLFCQLISRVKGYSARCAICHQNVQEKSLYVSFKFMVSIDMTYSLDPKGSSVARYRVIVQRVTSNFFVSMVQPVQYSQGIFVITGSTKLNNGS